MPGVTSPGPGMPGSFAASRASPDLRPGSAAGSAGGLSASRPAPSLAGEPSQNLDDLPDEEKAKVLRRHLVSKEERERQQQAGGLETPGSQTGSRRGSGAGLARRPSRTALQRQETEAFPVPYDAPGADVTYVPFPHQYNL
jgi:proton-coupled amino acid transporter